MKPRERTCCEIARINGILTHEIGCTDAWRDYGRECPNCGQEFEPESRFQTYCDPSCYAMFHGLPDPNDKIPVADDEQAEVAS